MKIVTCASIALTGTLLLGGPLPAFASGYGGCDLSAIVLCNDGKGSDDETDAAQLKFKVTGNPKCGGLGIKDIEDGQIVESSVRLPEELRTQPIRPGSVIRLRYDYSEGLTPDGFESHRTWSLVAVEDWGSE